MPDAPSERALKRTTVSAPRERRFGSKVFGAPSPEEVRRARRAAQTGHPARWFALLEWFFDTDTEIPGAVDSLVEAVMQEAINVDALDDSAEARRQVEDVTAMLEHLDLEGLVREALEMRYYGMTAAWVDWDAVDYGTGVLQGPATYELLPRDWLWADRRGTDEFSTLMVGDRPYHDYERGSVLLFTQRKLPSSRDIDFTRFGVGMATARLASFGYFAVEDWAAYAEVFGMPTIIGVLLEGWDEKDKDLLTTAVNSVSNEARGVLTDKARLEKFEAAASSGETFEKFADWCERGKAKIIKGESLTDNMGAHGSNAAMLTVNGIRLDFARGIARMAARTLTRRLVDPFCGLNYNRRLVRLSFTIKEVKNLVAELTIDKGLHEMGVELSRSELRERYGRRAPDPNDADDIVTPRSAGGALPGLFGGA